ncbi:MAG: ABC transporter ATP-binding protein, partial [Lachnospiraceae bacterium]|nr:ABC transporter ATP-binding protein [Lachnospiraceae bacterium]
LSKEALEEMLRKYTGTVIFVSHDRYFISKIAGSVLEILPGDAKLYPFGYEDYLEKSGHAIMSTKQNAAGSVNRNGIFMGRLDDIMSTKTNADGNVGGKSAGSIAPAEPTKAQLSYQAGKELSRLQKKLEKIEADLAQVEDEIQKKKDELLDPAYASDYVHLKELQDQIDFDEEKILTLMEAYEETDEAIRELAT